MSAMELVVMLLAVSAGLRLVARRINVPHPVLLVIGGLALAFAPRLPQITIAPDTLFLLFVPPLRYWAALTTSLRDFRRQFSPIVRYATLVVLMTMVAVAAVVHALSPAFSWAAAFVLGAIVAPPDPVAAIAVLRLTRRTAGDGHDSRRRRAGQRRDATAVSILRFAARRRGETGPRWAQATFIGWTGMRGGDSLVIALALP